ncbi:dihydrodipicolinate reductase [Seinonella peptonophila]|uniref:4-hydroxy-tetrahydrodipicolinate reductase n=1 Tax=Seinonella peptonophila TaxID=112248 RepID=A0A1M4SUK2_9BACL|nr:4-hydroxy-tetrahydrodipicolinate reductase [Seinonella peptonophila]SHE35891.1 dihydrodipicolinate reductase [Seinonella peptonophila]
MNIQVIVAGSTGKMGREVVKMLGQHEYFEFVCGVSRSLAGKDAGEAIGLSHLGVPLVASVQEAIQRYPHADVLVDFTQPRSVLEHAFMALNAGIRPVIGTSGLNEEQIERLKNEAQQKNLGAIVAPNFAIGAVLMMVFAAQAAKYLPHVEIVESHHDQKLDAPSGTAVKTAESILEHRSGIIEQGHNQEEELLQGARGAYYHGFRIHSIRLPGLIAHQEVLFGGSGQLLTIRHDSFDRESFMPGVKIAIEQVMKKDELIYGLEKLLEE